MQCELRADRQTSTLSPAELVVGGESGAVVDVVGVKDHRKRRRVGQQPDGGATAAGGGAPGRRRAAEPPLTLSTAAAAAAAAAVAVDQPRRDVTQLDVVALRRRHAPAPTPTSRAQRDAMREVGYSCFIDTSRRR